MEGRPHNLQSEARGQGCSFLVGGGKLKSLPELGRIYERMKQPTLKWKAHPQCLKPYNSIHKSSQFLKHLDAEIGFIRNTGVGGPSLLQGIFQTQGLNPGLPHCRWILYQLSYKRSPRIPECVAYPFSRGSSQPRNQTGVSCIAGRCFTS